jgi:DGQHR domain-containing protein
MENIITARKVVQNNQEFLLGVFKTSQVQNFTRYTERILVGFEDESSNDEYFEGQTIRTPSYNDQIQRKTNNAKVERIADYLITDSMSMFPTNIIIAIPQQVIDQQTQDINGNVSIVLNEIVKRELEKPDGDVFLTIVDGQHRIKGIERAIERTQLDLMDDSLDIAVKEKCRVTLNRLLNFELIVTFFIDPILEYQAMIFSIINKTQTKVPENLVFSLFGLTTKDTPQKTSLEVVLALNGLQKSPFFNRIKLVGGNYKRGENIPLSQASMVKSILFNICKNQRESEIERTKSREDLMDNPNDLVFRRYYATNNDKMIVRIMYAYFSAVKDTLTTDNGLSYWELDSTEEVNVLQTNVGYQALMKLLDDILKITPEENRDVKKTYSDLLVKAKGLNFMDDGVEKRYPFTSKSINVLYGDLKRAIELE